ACRSSLRQKVRPICGICWRSQSLRFAPGSWTPNWPIRSAISELDSCALSRYPTWKPDSWPLKHQRRAVMANLKRRVEGLERRLAKRPSQSIQFDEDALAIYKSMSYLDATMDPTYHDVDDLSRDGVLQKPKDR